MRGLDCVSEADLKHFLLGELPDPIARSIAQHLDTCSLCGEEVRRLDRLTDPVIRCLRNAFPDPAKSTLTIPPPVPDTVDGGGTKLVAPSPTPK